MCELGVPTHAYPSPVGNAFEILRAALDATVVAPAEPVLGLCATYFTEMHSEPHALRSTCDDWQPLVAAAPTQSPEEESHE